MSTKTPDFETYPFKVEPLPADEGGGFLITFPDLPGCMSDGTTYEEAIANGRDAFLAWMRAQAEDKARIPQPNDEGQPARFVLRLPRSIHDRLLRAAASDGASMNTLVTTFVAEGLVRREAPLVLDSVQRRAERFGQNLARPGAGVVVDSGRPSLLVKEMPGNDWPEQGWASDVGSSTSYAVLRPGMRSGKVTRQ